MIGIIGALELEVNSLCEKLDSEEKIEYANITFHKGFLNKKEVVIVKCGVGKVNASVCTQILITQFKVEKIINTGVAGAIDSDLRNFDFIVSTSTVYHDFETTDSDVKKGQVPGMPEQFIADSKMVDIAISSFKETEFLKKHKIQKGLIATGDQFITEITKKEYIKSNFSPLCVDMEGCAISHVCYLFKIPFVIVRCVSDMADENAEGAFAFNAEYCGNASATLVTKIIKKL